MSRSRCPSPLRNPRSRPTVRSPAAAQLVDIDLIEPSPYQPRTHFREEALAELAQSIQASGIIQPLVLRPVGSRFQFLAGERRWRAAQRAGLARVPAVMREVNDAAALEITLVENIQREDLNPVEEARAFERLMRRVPPHAGRSCDSHRQRPHDHRQRRSAPSPGKTCARPNRRWPHLARTRPRSAGHHRSKASRRSVAQRAARGGLTVRQLERLASRRSRAPVSSHGRAADRRRIRAPRSSSFSRRWALG